MYKHNVDPTEMKEDFTQRPLVCPIELARLCLALQNLVHPSRASKAGTALQARHRVGAQRFKGSGRNRLAELVWLAPLLCSSHTLIRAS